MNISFKKTCLLSTLVLNATVFCAGLDTKSFEEKKRAIIAEAKNRRDGNPSEHSLDLDDIWDSVTKDQESIFLLDLRDPILMSTKLPSVWVIFNMTLSKIEKLSIYKEAYNNLSNDALWKELMLIACKEGNATAELRWYTNAITIVYIDLLRESLRS